jgi:hypothetical protein
MMIAQSLLGFHLTTSPFINDTTLCFLYLPHPYRTGHNTMDDSIMNERDSSPLFMPQDEPEGNASLPKRGEESSSGNGNGNGMDTDMIDVRSDQDASESQPNPQEPYAQGAESMAFWHGSNNQVGASHGLKAVPEVKDGQFSGPPPPLNTNTFTPITSPKPAPRSFSPLTSKAERKRRRVEREKAAAAAAAAASEPPDPTVAHTAPETSDHDITTVARPVNGTPKQDVAPTALETSDPDTIVVAQRANSATRLVSPYEAEAAKTYNKPPNDTLETSDDDDNIIVAPRRTPATTPVSPYEAEAAKTYNRPPNDALKTSDDNEDTIVVARRPRPGRPTIQPTSPYDAAAPKTSNAPPNEALASFALGNSSRESVGLRHLAARNTIVHKELKRQRIENATPNRFATPGGNNSCFSLPRPAQAQASKKAAESLKLLPGARQHLDFLQTKLREEQDAACDREEHLTVLLEQARDIRKRAITDRENGLVVIRNRKMKLESLEQRLRAGEEIGDGELMELLKMLDLGVPVEREAFEKMKRDGSEDGVGGD